MKPLIIYDIALLLSYLFSRVVYNKGNKGLRKKSGWDLDFILFCLFALLFIVITSFRNPYFGGPDTINYCEYYAGEKGSYYYHIDTIKDVGYIFINEIFSFLSRDYHFFIFWSSLFIFFPILYGIYKYSGDKLLSLLLLSVNIPDVWIQGMCAYRQFFATAFLLWAVIVYMSNVKYKSYIIGALLVMSFLCHSSFVITILFFVLFGYKIIDRKILFLCLIVTWLLIFFDDVYSKVMDMFYSMNPIEDSILEKYHNRYMNINYMVNKTPLNMLPLNLLPACVLYFSRENDNNRRLIQIYVLGFCIYNILCKSQIGMRMVAPFIIIGIISLPKVTFSNKNTNRYKYIISALVAYITWRTIEILNWYSVLKEQYFNYSFWD